MCGQMAAVRIYLTGGHGASQKCQGALFVILQRGATLNSEDYGTEAFRAPTRTISVPGTTGKSERLVGIIDVEVCVAAALGVGCVGAAP